MRPVRIQPLVVPHLRPYFTFPSTFSLQKAFIVQVSTGVSSWLLPSMTFLAIELCYKIIIYHILSVKKKKCCFLPVMLLL
jgi:hypothetical protein